MSDAQITTLHRYLDAYAAKDLAAIAALLSPRVRLQDWNVAGEGLDFVLAETRRNFEAVRTLAIEVQHRYSAPGRAAAQLRITIDGTLTLEVVDVLSFDGEGRIEAIRAYKG